MDIPLVHCDRCEQDIESPVWMTHVKTRCQTVSLGGPGDPEMAGYYRSTGSCEECAGLSRRGEFLESSVEELLHHGPDVQHACLRCQQLVNDYYTHDRRGSPADWDHVYLGPRPSVVPIEYWDGGSVSYEWLGRPDDDAAGEYGLGTLRINDTNEEGYVHLAWDLPTWAPEGAPEGAVGDATGERSDTVTTRGAGASAPVSLTIRRHGSVRKFIPTPNRDHYLRVLRAYEEEVNPDWRVHARARPDAPEKTLSERVDACYTTSRRVDYAGNHDHTNPDHYQIDLHGDPVKVNHAAQVHPLGCRDYQVCIAEGWREADKKVAKKMVDWERIAASFPGWAEAAQPGKTNLELMIGEWFFTVGPWLQPAFNNPNNHEKVKGAAKWFLNEYFGQIRRSPIADAYGAGGNKMPPIDVGFEWGMDQAGDVAPWKKRVHLNVVHPLLAFDPMWGSQTRLDPNTGSMVIDVMPGYRPLPHFIDPDRAQRLWNKELDKFFGRQPKPSNPPHFQFFRCSETGMCKTHKRLEPLVQRKLEYYHKPEVQRIAKSVIAIDEEYGLARWAPPSKPGKLRHDPIWVPLATLAKAIDIAVPRFRGRSFTRVGRMGWMQHNSRLPLSMTLDAVTHALITTRDFAFALRNRGKTALFIEVSMPGEDDTIVYKIDPDTEMALSPDVVRSAMGGHDPRGDDGWVWLKLRHATLRRAKKVALMGFDQMTMKRMDEAERDARVDEDMSCPVCGKCDLMTVGYIVDSQTLERIKDATWEEVEPPPDWWTGPPLVMGALA